MKSPTVVQDAAILFVSLLAAGAAPAQAPGAQGRAQEPAKPNATAAAAKPVWPPALADAAQVATQKSDQLVVTWAGKALAEDHPYDPAWKLAAYREVPLLPQQIAMPTLAKATVESMTVQSLTDGARIAFRVEWKDQSADGNVDAGRFSDAVALQFPLSPNATPTMGHIEAKVHMLYWKALWQKDADVGFQDVQDLHPNYWTDLYWFADAAGPRPARVPESFQDPTSHQWFIAHQAGNPMAVFSRAQPVEELVAKGWGTTTHQEQSASQGRGFWVHDRWAVVFSRPLHTDDPEDYQFEAGAAGRIGFAVWDGSAGNAGGRKHWAPEWVTFEFPALPAKPGKEQQQ